MSRLLICNESKWGSADHNKNKKVVIQPFLIYSVSFEAIEYLWMWNLNPLFVDNLFLCTVTIDLGGFFFHFALQQPESTRSFIKWKINFELEFNALLLWNLWCFFCSFDSLTASLSWYLKSGQDIRHFSFNVLMKNGLEKIKSNNQIKMLWKQAHFLILPVIYNRSQFPP